MNLPQDKSSDSGEVIVKRHQLPPLKYDYAALEPCIDTRTMMLHHDIHHGQ